MKKREPKTLGERIRHVRGNLTQIEFAETLRIRQAMISRYEADKETPSPRILMRIAQFSGKSMEWLLTGLETGDSESYEKNITLGGPRRMTRKDHLNMAARHLYELKIPESKEFINMMKDLYNNPKLMEKVLDYYRFALHDRMAKKKPS